LNINTHVTAEAFVRFFTFKIFFACINVSFIVFLEAPQYAYELGALDTHLSFDELRKRSYINPKASALGDDPDFSRKIRQGLPRPRG